MLKKNIIYQVLYQIIILFVPLILSKYVTNVFSKETLGIYNYSYSIANYFVLLGMLGIQKYGTRLISQNKENSLDLRKAFWSLMIVHLFFSTISLIAFIIISFFVDKNNSNIVLLQALYVASSLFDITWLFYGLENFKSVVFKNLFIKIAEVFLILIFVKTNSDLWKYTLIMSSSVFLGQIVMIPQAIKQIKPIKIGINELKIHVKPLLILSIAVLSTSIYGVLDKVILGLLSPNGKGDVSIYEYSDKIVRIPLNIIAAIETAMLPKMSYISQYENEKKLKEIIENSTVIISMISIGAMFGIASISNSFTILWYGKDFAQCSNVIFLLSPIIFICSFGDIIRSQYLIPQKKDTYYTISLVVGAVLNLFLNLTLIPSYGIYGAILGTIVSELFISFMQLIFVKKEINIFKLIIKPLPYFFCGFIIFSLNKIMEHFFKISYLLLILQISLGLIVYLCLIFLCIKIFEKNLFLYLRNYNKRKEKKE